MILTIDDIERIIILYGITLIFVLIATIAYNYKIIDLRHRIEQLEKKKK